MSGGLFDDDPLMDDDYLDGMHDDEEEEIGSDFHVHTELTDTPAEVASSSSPSSSSGAGIRRAKIKTMPKALQKHNIATMLVTRTDGRQVLFVNPNASRSK